MIAIVQALRAGRITRATFPRDALSGLVVGIVAIPLAMAFAIASGLEPQQGFVTGIVAGLLAALFGGSMVQVSGPTGAFVVILLGIVQSHGAGGLMLASAMAGGILLVLGLARLGGVIRFIPHPVTLGFTAGIGVIIFTGQIHEFFGLSLSPPREFVDKVGALASAAPSWHARTAAVAAATLATLIAWPRLARLSPGFARVARRIPSPLVGILVGATLARVLAWNDVATIGSRFGGIPSALPSFAVPLYEGSWTDLVKPAFTIAMLGAIESLLSAVVADGMTGDSHDSNQELIGQGIANVVCPFFGGFAATGAIARTATNVRNGGRSPVAALVHCLVLLATVLVLAPYAAAIPLACLAAILFVVAWNMSEVHEFASLVTSGAWSDRVVLLVTFLLTVFVDLVVAVEVGVVLAALLFMKHMSARVEMHTSSEAELGPDPFQGLATTLPPSIRAYSIDGPLFFGSARRFENVVGDAGPDVQVVIVRLWRVPYLDATGVHGLRRVLHALRRTGHDVLLSGVRPEVRDAIERSGLLAEVGEGNVWATFEEALAAARDLVVEREIAERAAARGTRPA